MKLHANVQTRNRARALAAQQRRSSNASGFHRAVTKGKRDRRGAGRAAIRYSRAAG